MAEEIWNQRECLEHQIMTKQVHQDFYEHAKVGETVRDTVNKHNLVIDSIEYRIKSIEDNVVTIFEKIDDIKEQMLNFKWQVAIITGILLYSKDGITYLIGTLIK